MSIKAVCDASSGGLRGVCTKHTDLMQDRHVKSIGLETSQGDLD
jgi:hypothetical protein